MAEYLAQLTVDGEPGLVPYLPRCGVLGGGEHRGDGEVDEVVDRPKGYFPVPALKTLEGGYLELVRDALGSKAARERGLFRRAYVDELLADPDRRTPLGASRLWQLGLLELWLQANDIG